MKNKKMFTLAVSVLLVLVFFVGSTMAILKVETDPVENKFNPSKVTTEIEEDFDNEVKSNVKIKNTGDTDAFIRATVVVTWQNGAGEVYGKPVQTTDYSISYNTSPQNGGQWVLAADGFYYWTSEVRAGNLTGVLINECKPTVAAPEEGYYLHVEIIGSGIQSVPADAVTSAWSSGVSGVTETTLNIKKASN